MAGSLLTRSAFPPPPTLSPASSPSPLPRAPLLTVPSHHTANPPTVSPRCLQRGPCRFKNGHLYTYIYIHIYFYVYIRIYTHTHTHRYTHVHPPPSLGIYLNTNLLFFFFNYFLFLLSIRFCSFINRLFLIYIYCLFGMDVNGTNGFNQEITYANN